MQIVLNVSILGALGAKYSFGNDCTGPRIRPPLGCSFGCFDSLLMLFVRKNVVLLIHDHSKLLEESALKEDSCIEQEHCYAYSWPQEAQSPCSAMDNEPTNLKSLHSEVRSFVNFINTTQRDVDVFWVNYSSKHIHYTVLVPGAQCMVNTYVTHPWAFRDRITGEKMHVKHRPIYLPEPWYTNFDINGQLARKEIKIHFPVRTLLDNCLWKILALVPECEGDSALRELELPRLLIHELLCRRKNKIMNK